MSKLYTFHLLRPLWDRSVWKISKNVDLCFWDKQWDCLHWAFLRILDHLFSSTLVNQYITTMECKLYHMKRTMPLGLLTYFVKGHMNNSTFFWWENLKSLADVIGASCVRIKDVFNSQHQSFDLMLIKGELKRFSCWQGIKCIKANS